MRRNLIAAVGLVCAALTLASCTQASTHSRGASSGSSSSGAGSPTPTQVRVRAAGRYLCGNTVSSGAVSSLLATRGPVAPGAGGEVSLAESQATSKQTCFLDGGDATAVSITTAFGTSAGAAYQDAYAFDDGKPALSHGTVPTPYVSTKRLAVVGRYLCGSSPVIVDVHASISYRHPVSNAADALRTFTELIRQRIATLRHCAMSPAGYRPTVAGSVRTIAGDGRLGFPSDTTHSVAATSAIGRARAMTKAPDGSLYLAVTDFTAQDLAGPQSNLSGGTDMDGAHGALLRVMPGGRVEHVRLRDVAAPEGSASGVPDTHIADMTWHDGLLWVLTASADRSDLSHLYRIDPSTGQSDQVEEDEGIVDDAGKQYSMSDLRKHPSAEWQKRQWSAVTFDNNGPVLLDTTLRAVWHTTLKDSKYVKSPFAMSFATARRTPLAANVPALATQGDTDPEYQDQGGPGRPAVGLPDGRFVASAASDASLVAIDGSGRTTGHSARGVGGDFFSDPRSPDDPLVLAGGNRIQTVNQRTLKMTTFHDVDHALDPRYAAFYSDDPFNSDAFTTFASGPVAWDRGSVLMSVNDSGDYRLVRLTPR